MRQEDNRLPELHYQYLVHLFDTESTSSIHEFLVHSDVYLRLYSDPRDRKIQGGLSFIVNPEIYKKYQNYESRFSELIAEKYEQFTGNNIGETVVLPNLIKFQILKNSYTPIITPWEEINTGQQHLIDSLRIAQEIIDYQNIGNSARTLLQKLANIVFNPEKHKTSDTSIDLSEGKFKNRLHTYIKIELEGKKNKILRDFIVSIVSTAEKSIDIANNLTHDLKANKLLAESCIISTITVTSMVKLIESK